MLLAIGLTLVIATHGIDISVGSVVAISAGVVAILIGGDLAGHPKYPHRRGHGRWRSLVCTAAGMWNGMLVSRIGMQPIIATLILFVAGRGIAMVFTNAMVIWLYIKPFAILGQGYVLGLPFSIYIVGFLLLLTYLFTRRTAVGMFIEAVGINPTAARFSGINSREHHLLGVHLQRVLRGNLGPGRGLHGHERGRQQRRQPLSSWMPSWRSCWAARR